MAPLISIVIPTRERADTLRYTLQTALDQDSKNFEVVVSDNASQDNTKAVVEGVRDSRVVYVNTGNRVSMCDNWEFALKHTTGEYVVYIGDDDGVMPGAINKLQRLIETVPSQVYQWQPHCYTWPIDQSGPIVEFIAPATTPREIDLSQLARFSLHWGTWRANVLPALYHSAVARSVLLAIGERTGKVFHSAAPDIFMKFALPAMTSKATHVGEGLTVNGRSAKSNGGSLIAKQGANSWQTFIEEYGGYKVHPTLSTAVPFAVNIIPDSALVAMDLFPEHYRDIKLNYDAMWAFMQRSLKFDGVLGIVGKRSTIRQTHPFSVPRFLFYCGVHKVLDLRILLRRATGGTSGEGLATGCPDNVRDFAKAVSAGSGRS